MRPLHQFRGFVFGSLLLLAGCTSVRQQDAAEAQGFERGYRQAVKDQYWIIQNQQRLPEAPPGGREP